MADKTININSQPQCNTPNTNAKKNADRVRWHALNSAACVEFEEDDWPFEEAYVAQISISSGDYSSYYTPDEVGTFTYNYSCSACTSKKLTNGLSASIIISE